MIKVTFSKRQVFTLIIATCVNFFLSSCVSLQAPFYPKEAEMKGATATEYGFVFGIYELVSFITSPYFGKIVDKIGAKLLLGSGMALSSASTILFGLLDSIWNRTIFIAMSFLLRIVESIGATAAIVSSFSLIGSMFPDNFGTIFATLEIFYGCGYIVGPTIGGILYNFGGYSCPFIFLGIVTAIVALTILLFVPDVTEPYNKHLNNEGKLLIALKIPSIAIDAACEAAIAISSGFLSATLEPHIRVFGISPISTGFMFIISAGTYAIIAPFCGALVDKRVDAKKMLIFGCLLSITSFSVIGPLPFLPISSTLTTCIIALFIHGFAMAFINVATFSDSIRTAIEVGFPETVSTYGLISGIWLSAFSLGAFIGPSAAGVLHDLVGFQYSTLFVIFINLLLLIILISRMFFNKFERKSKSIGKKLFYIQDDVSDNSIFMSSNFDNLTVCLIPEQKSSFTATKMLPVNGKYMGNGYGAVQI